MMSKLDKKNFNLMITAVSEKNNYSWTIDIWILEQKEDAGHSNVMQCIYSSKEASASQNVA